MDQASNRSGWALFIDGKYIESGLIDFSGYKITPEERFQKMCIYLRNIIVQNVPDCVVFEGVSLQNNPSTLTLLARLQGAMIQTCLNCKITYEILPASSWRKLLCFNQGRGIARKQLKEQAIEYVKIAYGITVKEDIAEAICIGKALIKKQKDEVEANG